MPSDHFKNSLRKLLLYSLAVLAAGLYSCKAPSSQNGTEQAGHISKEDSLLTERIFFLLAKIEETPGVKRSIRQDTALVRVLQQERQRIRQGMADCPDLKCLSDKLLITENENNEIGTLLGRLFRTSDTIRNFVRNVLRPSGAFIISGDLPDSAFLIRAWNEERAGLNYIINAYLKGKGMHYPRIDSARFSISSPAYYDSVKKAISGSVKQDKAGRLFFRPTLDICLAVLKLNGRNEAIRFLPLSSVNQAAYDRADKINWENYEYSSILVFGHGPEERGVPIDEINKERCRTAAACYNAKKAPLIIVSGGYVHPFRTKYCEAQQMKKYLTDSLGIPADRIVMEPHARHTTTNIRNANRIIYRNKIPADKPVLGVSSPDHIKYIVGKRFERVCRRDLHYLPFERMKRLSDETAAFYPTRLSFQINAEEPLDP